MRNTNNTFDFNNSSLPTHSEHPDGTSTIMEFIIQGVGVLSVASAGIISNLLCLLVLCQPSLKKGHGSVNSILISMAAIDILVVSCAILMCGIPGIGLYGLVFNCTDYAGSDFIKTMESVFPYTTPYVYPIGLIAQTASVYLTVLVTVERYIAVCHPLKAKLMCTEFRTKRMVLAVIFFSVLYNISRFFEYNHEKVVTWQGEDVLETKYVTRLAATSLRLDRRYVAIYINWMYLVIMYVIPFTLLLSLNWKIWTEINTARLRRSVMRKAELTSADFFDDKNDSPMWKTTDSSRERQIREKEEKDQHNLAMMLMFVVIIFMLCNVTAMVTNILEAVEVNAAWMTFFSNLFVTLNSTVNLFIYCTFGANFRRELKLLYRRALCRRRYNSRSASSFSLHGTTMVVPTSTFIRRELGAVSQKAGFTEPNPEDVPLVESPQNFPIGHNEPNVASGCHREIELLTNV